MRSVVAALVLPVLLLTGCSAAQPTAAPTSIAPTVASPSPRSTPVYTTTPTPRSEPVYTATPGEAPQLSEGRVRLSTDEGYMLDMLGSIEPGLAWDKESALARLETTCINMNGGMPESDLILDAMERFRYRGAGVGPGDAKVIVDAARERWC